jgi:hypothetical protein
MADNYYHSPRLMVVTHQLLRHSMRSKNISVVIQVDLKTIHEHSSLMVTEMQLWSRRFSVVDVSNPGFTPDGTGVYATGT